LYLTHRLPRETGRDYALRTLKDNIIRLELAPGSMLSENELASELGLSRTPVREALIELAKVNIVEIFPQRGSGIALIDYAMVEEARFVRYHLEREVAALNCEMAGPEDVDVLQAIVDRHRVCVESGDADVMLQADNDFHRELFRIADKLRVYGIMENLSIHFDRVRRMHLLITRDPEVVDDHQGIVNAVAARQPEAARQRMEAHLTRYKADEKNIKTVYAAYFK